MQTPWLTIFDHRFIDRNVKNFRHIDGSIDLSSPPPQVGEDQLPDGVVSYYGRFNNQPSWLVFSPSKWLGQIIGTEVSIKLRLPQPLIQNQIATFFWGATDTYTTDLTGSYFWGEWGMVLRADQLDLIYKGDATSWTGFPNTPNFWFDIRWSYRYTGQSILSVNGSIVAVRALNPSFHGLFAIGLGFQSLNGSPAQSFPLDISQARVSILTQERAEKSLDSAIPIEQADSERLDPCKEEIVDAVQALTQLFQELMVRNVSSS